MKSDTQVDSQSLIMQWLIANLTARMSRRSSSYLSPMKHHVLPRRAVLAAFIRYDSFLQVPVLAYVNDLLVPSIPPLEYPDPLPETSNLLYAASDPLR